MGGSGSIPDRGKPQVVPHSLSYRLDLYVDEWQRLEVTRVQTEVLSGRREEEPQQSCCGSEPEIILEESLCG